MDLLHFVLIVSILLQFVAAGMALMLIPVTHHRTAWILISAALILMGTRRIIGMLGLSELLGRYVFVMELVALVISILMVVGVFRIRDVFYRLRQYADRQEHCRQIIDSTSDLVGSIQPDGQMVYLNRAGRRLAGLDGQTEPDGLNIRDLYEAAEGERIFQSVLPRVEADGSWRGNTALKPRNGAAPVALSEVWIAHPRDREGKVPCYSIIARDITERQKLIHSLEELSRSRELLLTVLAHDLRGPIGNSLTLVHMLREEIAGLDREEISSQLEMIEGILGKNQDRMEEILTWVRSQISHAEICLETIPMKDLLEPVAASVEEVVRERCLHFEVRAPEGLSVATDRQIAQTVLRNLVANAVRFTPREGSVQISAEEDGEAVRIRVTDSGNGMSADQRDKINRGIPVQSQADADGLTGHGIGLSMCQALMGTLRKHWPVCSLEVKHTSPEGTAMEAVFQRADSAT